MKLDYLSFVRSGPGKFIAKKTGLPEPADLPRFKDRPQPILGPVLVLGNSQGTEDIANQLLAWDGDVRRHGDELDKIGSIIVVLDDIVEPGQTGPIIAELPAAFKKMKKGGRVITVSRTPLEDDPAVNAARAGLEGFIRTLAKEARYGTTANGILVDDDVELTSSSVIGALRFLLTAKSAFITGQTLRVSAEGGGIPTLWEQHLSGRVALVTGAARGIGAAIARTLHRDGAKVIILDVPAAGSALTDLANEIGAIPLQMDITADNAGERIVEELAKRDLKVNVFVHNAGITRDKYYVNMSEDRWNSVIDVNIAAQLRINNALLASDRIGDQFRLVSLASTSGVAGNAGQANYAYSKSAVMGMVAALGPILAERGGTANAVAPGFIETEMTGKIPAVQREVFRRSNSLKQGGLPLDVAETVSFLGSLPAGGYVGQTLRVCGQNLVGR
ncbi:3-oxoacyl-ACP reductase [Flaviflexus ciconiae]|uniref:3-oxoacyl-ACP reductase n=1 Tax=Flaviflexus ciconiae TaxID=2496867 RepID=A0A3Q9G8L3_9ACTO|nr:3-oxoacyl-ACP reductase [Flaviflexus ciconiae]AZQ77588.1 3-oxoacyl-ACP reductase [Flaviflexus ciconiae]